MKQVAYKSETKDRLVMAAESRHAVKNQKKGDNNTHQLPISKLIGIKMSANAQQD